MSASERPPGTSAQRAGPDDPTAGGQPSAAAGAATDRTIPPEEQTFYCDLCGNEMLNLHCKLVCEQCGYKRDCSDP